MVVLGVICNVKGNCRIKGELDESILTVRLKKLVLVTVPAVMVD